MRRVFSSVAAVTLAFSCSLSFASSALADAVGERCTSPKAARVAVLTLDGAGPCLGFVTSTNKAVALAEPISGDALRSADGRTVVFIASWLPSPDAALEKVNAPAVVVYRDGQLVAKHMLRDLVDVKALTRSISHVQWIKSQPDVIGPKSFEIVANDGTKLVFDSTTGARL